MTCIEATKAAKDRPGKVGAMPIKEKKWVLVYSLELGWCKRTSIPHKRGGGLTSPCRCTGIAPQLLLEQWTTVEIKP